MTGLATSNNLNEYLDILGQQPLLKMYTQICFCFPVDDDSLHLAIVKTLTNGLKRLAVGFPWLAGQVINEGASEGNSGLFKIIPWEKVPRLVVKDLRDDPSAPTMDGLRKANFPFSMLDEDIIAPRRTLPGSPKEATEPALVFIVQANFITGGLILTINGQHGTMDMTGQGQVMDLFSKACRNEPFTTEELRISNLPRHNLIPFLDATHDPTPCLAHQIIPPSLLDPPSPEGPATAPTPATWVYYTFPAASLTALKTHATQTKPSDTPFISTDDALTALLWQSVARARLGRLGPARSTTLARAIDVRRHLSIPATYPGVVQNMTYHSSALGTLAVEPLGVVAARLREAVEPGTSELALRTRQLATLMLRAADKARVSVAAAILPAADLMLSSWARLDCYELDFGLGLGAPEAVRRPRFEAVEGLVYFMPRARDGAVAVGLCLSDEDLGRFGADVEAGSYGVSIG
ncbi:trichothecene 3-O-acetyltransferase [Glonium stellatum]|uniref:Trichothecene 3-O-acetyltransferase n=1 Tax=Glonium stellatum TaxID=574774 RepID=A0A8E2F407_9PEZI|nr:trichothecene 3-O-acetyltransferase [Glonium stellatum]